MRNIISVLFVGLVILRAISGASYQTIQVRLAARQFSQKSKSVDVCGYRLNLDCTGPGSPTVEAGLASFLFSWQEVQPGFAKFTRVCSYDRAGYAWSDPSPLPRTSAQIARELHALLENAREKRPYVVVGHSFGGLDIRVYNGIYPNEVAGMVLSESSHPDLLDRMPPSIKIMSDNAQQRERQVLFAPLLYRLGIAPFMLRREIESPSYRRRW